MIKLNGRELKIEKFPNNEQMIDADKLMKPHNSLNLMYETDFDLMSLYYLVSYMKEKRMTCELIIPYMPYSRSDRYFERNIVNIKSVSKFINDMRFEKVTIMEPHSDVTTMLLDSVVVHNTTLYLAKIYIEELLENYDAEDILIVFPDATAKKRYSKDKFLGKFENATCNKSRDENTGRITDMSLSTKAKKVKVSVILDDLCSRGGTFMLTANLLEEELGIKKNYLVVTHCENSIHSGGLLTDDRIVKVVTTDSLRPEVHEKIIINNSETIVGGIL